MKPIQLTSSLVVCCALAACANTSTSQAPVTDLSSHASSLAAVKSAPATVGHPPAQGAVHVVQKGDTLIGIAMQSGLDYRELAAWNNVTDINHIQVGQVLRLTAPGGGTAAKPGVPADAGTGVEAMPLHLNSLPPQPAPAGKPPVAGSANAASAQITAAAGTAQMATSSAQPMPAVKGDWVWPASGPMLSGFTDAGLEGKGLVIGGKAGDPVLAASSGRVVYSGSGLHGYGKMLIIKHKADFSTVYAHNQTLLVKEGETVTQGQKIAEMGDTDADRPELLFEVRVMGKPVDPMQYLPAR